MVNCCGFLNEHPYINRLFVGLGLYTLDEIEYRQESRVWQKNNISYFLLPEIFNSVRKSINRQFLLCN